MNGARCDSCAIAIINGVRCHEQGCPKAHVGTVRECRECGTRFEPSRARQRECSHGCTIAYAGFDCHCVECEVAL